MGRTTWYFRTFDISTVFDEDCNKVVMHKAYFLDKIDDILSFQMDNDYLSISPEDAVQFLLYQSLSETHTNEKKELDLNELGFHSGDGIIVLSLKIDPRDLRMLPIWSLEEHDDKPLEWHGTIQVDLHNFRFSASEINQYILEDYDIKLDEKKIGNSWITVTISKTSKIDK